MPVERLSATNSRHEQIVGLLHRPEGVIDPPLIVSCPGLMSSKEGTKHVALGAAAEASSLALLRLDYSGIGESEGAFARSSLSQRVEDTRALLQAAAGRYAAAPRVAFVGSSFGAPTALLSAAQEKRNRAVAVCALVTWAATCDFSAALASSDAAALDTLRRGETLMRREGECTYCMPPMFLDDFARHDFAACLGTLGSTPTLFIHGREDEVVPYKQSEQLYAWACEPRRLLLYGEATHGLHEVLPALLEATLAWCCEAFRQA